MWLSIRLFILVVWVISWVQDPQSFCREFSKSMELISLFCPLDPLLGKEFEKYIQLLQRLYFSSCHRLLWHICDFVKIYYCGTVLFPPSVFDYFQDFILMEESIHNHVPMIFLYLKTTTEVKCFVLCSCFLKYTCCALYGLNLLLKLGKLKEKVIKGLIGTSNYKPWLRELCNHL